MAKRPLLFGGLAALVVALAAIAGVVFVARRDMAADPQKGAEVFATNFSPAQGLGPLYNNTSCLGCHNTPAAGGMGTAGLGTVLRVGQLTDAGFDPMLDRGGPIARAHSISELGAACDLVPGIPSGANVTSVRNAPSLFGLGRIDTIPDAVILAGAVPRGDPTQGQVNGHVNLDHGRVGRFGWKADTASLSQFVGEAFRNELGLTTPNAPVDLRPAQAGVCGALTGGPELDGSIVADVVAYIANLPAPAPGGARSISTELSAAPPGQSLNEVRPLFACCIPTVGRTSSSGDPTVFTQLGCAACHVPSLGGVPLYSDLLLHDMGSALNDGVVQSDARGQDWRTTPLSGLAQRSRFLHDGRARSVEAAILAHGGEADGVVQRFRGLSEADRGALLVFLSTL